MSPWRRENGEDRQTHEPIMLVMEASWLAEDQDVTRAHARVAVLRRIGLTALAVAGGDEWTESAAQLARQYHVVRTVDGQLDPASWRLAHENIK